MRGPGDQGSREATAEAATEAAAALSPAHRARSTRARARAASHPALPAGRRATDNQPQGWAASGSWVVARYWAEAGAQLSSPSAGPGDQWLIPLPPLTVTQAGDSPVAAKCRGPGVADSSAWRASLKKAEGGGDTRVSRVRPPGSPSELITAGAPRCGPRRPQVHARLPSAPTHRTPPGLGGDPEGTSPSPPPSCHIAGGGGNRQKDEEGYRPASVHSCQLARGLAAMLKLHESHFKNKKQKTSAAAGVPQLSCRLLHRPSLSLCLRF